MEDMEKELYSRLFGLVAGNEEEGWMAGLCQEESIKRGMERLEEAIKSAESGLSEEFILYDLRGALLALEEVTGRYFYPDLLDRIFSNFCIGK